MRSPRLFLAALAAAATACYSPSFPDCQIECGGSSGRLCPKGSTCLNDGFCHASLDEPLCTPGGDGDGDGDSDAGAVACDPGTATECELVSQCGCGPAEACDNDQAPTCRPAGGARQGDVCTAAEDCAAGFTCLGPAGGRACRRFCDDDSVCEGGGGLCNIDIGGRPQLVCTTDCDPVSSAGCAAGWGCSASFNNNTDRWHTSCHIGGAGTQDDPCSSLSDCAPGFHCVGLSPPFCARSCIVGSSSCSGGRTCTGFSGGAVIDGVEHGACL